MFAPLMHPAMRHVGPVRRELGVQTVMNMVGPLANPAQRGRQVVGVSDARRLALIAGALRELDTIHALVVHGAGMDEISPFGETQVIEIRDGDDDASGRSIRSATDSGGGAPDELGGGPPAENAATVLRVLRGEGNDAVDGGGRAQCRGGVLCRRRRARRSTKASTAATRGDRGGRGTRRARAAASSVRRDLTERRRLVGGAFRTGAWRVPARHAIADRATLSTDACTPTTMPWIVMSFSWTYIGCIVSFAGCRRMRPSRSR